MQFDVYALDSMFQELKQAPYPLQPSNTWIDLNRTNLAQLQDHGFKNMRNTLACNYFTFTGDRVQFRFLKSKLSKKQYLLNKLRALLALKLPRIRSALQSTTLTQDFLKTHTYYTQMLFDYAKKIDHKRLLKHIVNDSPLGNPPPVFRWGKLLTADLCNSVIEYYAITNSIGEAPLRTVMEIGAGYGRNAAVFLQVHQKLQYVICDIPPALYVSQSYLTQRFPEKKAFLFRPFKSFGEIQKEWEEAQLCFILPHQLALLPNKCVDLFLNISSFQEMRPEQISYYFSQINRLVHGYFYLKQWKHSCLPQDNVTIKEEDYPDFPHWFRIYSRTCEVQTAFFERLYDLKRS
ncbi:MAG: putative sugar O-methyltransferase [Verrucomicrobia bacterium]|nr:putative sugar O-methyltransferase [Verrucomicrobiota bacterium]MBS0645410.1 putative sugar O-methyltransferase [Verrucomicrobiota bacterium]